MLGGNPSRVRLSHPPLALTSTNAGSTRFALLLAKRWAGQQVDHRFGCRRVGASDAGRLTPSRSTRAAAGARPWPDDRNVTLREITTASRTELEALTMTPLQASYVESVAGSLAEAAATPDAAPWCRGVYAGDAPVGFVMISDGISPENMANPDYLGPYCLWRPLVDRAHQGRGHGPGRRPARRRAPPRAPPGRRGAAHLLWARRGRAVWLLPAPGLPCHRRHTPGRDRPRSPLRCRRSAGRPVPQRRASAGSLDRLDWRGGRLPSSGGPRRPREVSTRWLTVSADPATVGPQPNG